MDWGKVIEAGVALYGSMQSKKNEGKGMDAYSEGLRLLQSIVPPSLQDLAVTLTSAVQQGQITPEEFVAHLQEESAMEGVEIPSDILNMQYDTVRQLTEIVDKGGLTDIDKARLEDIKQQVATQARGRTQALKQEMQSRGMAGSGMETAARLQSGSDATAASSKMGFDVAAAAQERVLNALTQRGNMSNTMRDQSFKEQSSKAQATDAINRFNTGQLQDTSNRNVETANQAQEDNLRERQRISDVNNNIRNLQSKENANARQQVFDNEVRRAGGVVSQGNQVGNQYMGAAERDENQYAALANTLGGAFESEEEKDKKRKAEAEAKIRALGNLGSR